MNTKEMLFKGYSPFFDPEYPASTRNMVLLSTVPELININNNLMAVFISPEFIKVFGPPVYLELYKKLQAHLNMIPYLITAFFSLPQLFFPFILDIHVAKLISDSSFIAICNVCPNHPDSISFIQLISTSPTFKFNLHEYLTFIFKYSPNFAKVLINPDSYFSPSIFTKPKNPDENCNADGNKKDGSNGAQKSYLRETLDLYYDQIDENLLKILLQKAPDENVLIIFLAFLEEYITKSELLQRTLIPILESLLVLDHEEIVKKALNNLKILNHITPTFVFQALTKGFLTLHEAKSLLTPFTANDIAESDLFWFDLIFRNQIKTQPTLDSFKSVLIYGKPDLINAISNCFKMLKLNGNKVFTNFNWNSIIHLCMNIDITPFDKIISIMNEIPPFEITQELIENMDSQTINRGLNINRPQFKEYFSTIISNLH